MQIDKLLIDFRNARDWGQHHTGPELARSLMIEAAELNRIFQWPLMERPIDETALADELADIAIYTRYLCQKYGINLDAAIIAKVDKNAEKYPING
ncbi:MAG: nucleotide pyrophosphohydrolase [Dehalococcoidales bacterium]|jgi:NTP pyrophosphatase (non-canonical NTP hydrolase)|nr:nucleotide pyrophosphohydrolase [Candidatus Omnitrophota bacterium]MDX9804034.1 nucleotide pyrophosphohydrolase [Dehalococcoidales bacterium]